MQPHRSRYWLNANPQDPEVFRQQVTAVCDLYEQAGHLAEQGIHLVSTEQTVATDPAGCWVFITDNLNTHQSESLVLWVAQTCGIEADLGEKGKRGVLKSQKSRAAFLSQTGHRIRFVYTPKHTSWLNQIEMWFGILVRKLLRRSSFGSVEDLKARILAFLDYFNRTMAKPIRWIYSIEPRLANGTG